MATRTVVCPECDEPVPYGRLSCPACGSLLASVAGAVRRTEPPRAATVDEPVTGATVSEAPPVAPPARRRASTARRPATSRALGNGSSPEPPAPEPAVPAPSTPADDVVPASAPGDLDDVAEPSPPEVEVPPDAPAQPETPSWPDPAARAGAVATVAAPPAPPVLADWPPPSPVAPATSAGLRPAITTSEPVRGSHAAASLPPMPAGSWLPPSAAFGPAGNGTSNGGGPAVDAAAASKPRPGVASLFADLPFDAPADLPGWLVAIGSGLAVAGFLLPWANVVPGAAAFGGYTDRWGLAVPSHLLLFAATAAVLSMAIMPNRLPAWIRVGALPLALGGLLLGIVWPFVIGHVGSQVGSLSVAIGALVLTVGGLLEVRPRHHGGAESGV